MSPNTGRPNGRVLGSRNGFAAMRDSKDVRNVPPRLEMSRAAAHFPRRASVCTADDVRKKPPKARTSSAKLPLASHFSPAGDLPGFSIMTIKQDSVVTFHYTLKDDAGEVIDSSAEGEPLA